MTGIFDGLVFDSWILHALIWLPLAGIPVVLMAGEERAREVAFGWTLGLFVVSLGLLFSFDAAGPLFQLTSSTPWVEMWGVNYALGIDGISLFMILLTTFTMPVAILGSFKYIKERQRGFYALMLLLQTGIVGVFASMDLFLFYVFFELTLVPMYFIVGIWGGERRIYAAVKFFLYTALGSLLMLVGILYLYWQASIVNGFASFHVLDLLGTPLTLTEQLWLFGAFALAFAIKVPVFPLHTWLPDAHVEAPTPGSVVLAAVLLKMGTYGFLRFVLPFFPEASAHPTVVMVMLSLGVIGIIYAALVAAVQPDAKKLVAYTSVAHMGFVVLGIFALTVNGLQGGLMVMISHGISTGALFLILGMLYERRHTREIAAFGGLARVAPLLATALVLTAMASIGVPGTSGFVGEFLALLGTFERYPVIAFLGATGVIFAAFYMLPMVQRMLFNKLEGRENRTMPDLSAREITVLSPLLFLMIALGVYPAPVLDRMGPGVNAIVEWVEEGQTGALRSAADAHRQRGELVSVPAPAGAAGEQVLLAPIGVAPPPVPERLPEPVRTDEAELGRSASAFAQDPLPHVRAGTPSRIFSVTFGDQD
jgi:NADH-quinone oxidoreductase subunit M